MIDCARSRLNLIFLQMTEISLSQDHEFAHVNPLAYVEARRAQLSAMLQPTRRSALGQFFTPANVARIVAQQFKHLKGDIRLLDPGAGIGSLTAAVVERIIDERQPVTRCRLVAYEVEELFLADLKTCLNYCCAALNKMGVNAEYQIISQDFLDTAKIAGPTVTTGSTALYTHCILNPPYRKIGSSSEAHRMLTEAGIETTNKYSAFVWLAMLQLVESGEIASLTPRSFCNGVYFRKFRKALLSTVTIDAVHVFEERDVAFADDDVLQENIIIHAVRSSSRSGKVFVSRVSDLAGLQTSVSRVVDYSEFVRPDDPEQFLRIIPDGLSAALARQMTSLPSTLEDLGLDVSTGPVVDFRLRPWLCDANTEAGVPLIYPECLVDGRIVWPVAEPQKPTAIIRNDKTEAWLTNRGWYVIVRRFSSKEDKRRVVAAVSAPSNTDVFGIENHLNYYHAGGQGMEQYLAIGLAAFLNSTLSDAYFRQFSGHTQVNVADLKHLRYPLKNDLLRLGTKLYQRSSNLVDLDRLVQSELKLLKETEEAIEATKRIDEALEILKAVGLSKKQLGEQLALTLLSLADVTPQKSWQQAAAPERSIEEMLTWWGTYYGRQFDITPADLIRGQTVDAMVVDGLAVVHGCQSLHPCASANPHYALTAEAKSLLTTYGTPEWDTLLSSYLLNSKQWRLSRSGLQH